MRKYESLTGQNFGAWSVGEEVKRNGKIYYRCKCKCGTEKEVYRHSLINGDSTSCGCERNKKTSKRCSIDRTGERFGKLVLIERIPNYKNKRTYYRCLCECGNEILVSDSNLTTGHVKSCGCLTKIHMNRRKDYTGKHFGRLTVIEMLYNYGKNNRTYAKCVCECGNETIVDMQNLKNGATKSCGCLERESRLGRKHFLNIQNKKFGMLTPKKFLYVNSSGHAVWECQCDCGSIINVTTGNLTRGHTKSCGCNRYEANTVDLANVRFGKLVALYPIKGESQKRRKWICKCDCGNTTAVTTSDLTTGNTISCGCLVQSKMELYISKLLKKTKH